MSQEENEPDPLLPDEQDEFSVPAGNEEEPKNIASDSDSDGDDKCVVYFLANPIGRTYVGTSNDWRRRLR